MNQNREELLFQLALTKPANERAEFLDRECRNDAAMRARLEALLAAHEQPDESLQDATSEPAVKATRKLEFAEEPAELHRLSAFPRGTIFWATRAKRRADCLSSAHLRRSGTEKPGDDSILEAERMSTAMQI